MKGLCCLVIASVASGVPLSLRKAEQQGPVDVDVNMGGGVDLSGADTPEDLDIREDEKYFYATPQQEKKGGPVSFFAAKFDKHASKKGYVKLLVSHTSKMVPNGVESQVADWYPTHSPQLLAKGYTKWTVVSGGLVFKHKHGKRALQCQPSATPEDLGAALQLNLFCEESKEEPVLRFLQRRKATPEVDGFLGADEVKAQKRRAAKRKPLGQYWHKTCDGHVPFCLNQVEEAGANEADSDTLWGDFDFPFFAMDATAVYGCSQVDEGYCEMPIKYDLLAAGSKVEQVAMPAWHRQSEGQRMKEMMGQGTDVEDVTSADLRMQQRQREESMYESVEYSL